MSKAKPINTEPNVKVSVKNIFADMQDVIREDDSTNIANVPYLNLKKLSLNACKVLRIIIAQCERGDTEFNTYSFSVAELAKICNIKPSNLYTNKKTVIESDVENTLKSDVTYKEGSNIMHELFNLVLVGQLPNGQTIELHPFDKLLSSYKNGTFELTLSQSMKDLCLMLNQDNKGRFMQYLLCDVTSMRAKNSIRLYELIQQKLYFNTEKPFDTYLAISLEDIRKVTHTQDKFKELSNLKKWIINPALEEISKTKNWTIEKEYLRDGRRVDRVRLHIIHQQ